MITITTSNSIKVNTRLEGLPQRHRIVLHLAATGLCSGGEKDGTLWLAHGVQISRGAGPKERNPLGNSLLAFQRVQLADDARMVLLDCILLDHLKTKSSGAEQFIAAAVAAACGFPCMIVALPRVASVSAG